MLYNVHAVPPLTYQQQFNAGPHRRAMLNLLAKVAQEQGAILLAGDFNMTDQFMSYHKLTTNYTDAFRAVGEIGFGFTFPNEQQVPLPAFLRLDYIFYNDAFMGFRAKVWPNSGPSDHAPVLADLAFNHP